MNKIRLETLRKAVFYGSIDTSKYRYKIRNIDHYPNPLILVERKKLTDLETTTEWEPVALTLDGHYFTKL